MTVGPNLKRSITQMTPGATLITVHDSRKINVHLKLYDIALLYSHWNRMLPATTPFDRYLDASLALHSQGDTPRRRKSASL